MSLLNSLERYWFEICMKYGAMKVLQVEFKPKIKFSGIDIWTTPRFRYNEIKVNKQRKLRCSS
jgi:hypothetical protein